MQGKTSISSFSFKIRSRHSCSFISVPLLVPVLALLLFLNDISRIQVIVIQAI